MIPFKFIDEHINFSRIFLAMTTAQIEQENTQMINDLYRLLKKYLGLRHLIRELKVSIKRNEYQTLNIIV